MAAATVRSVFWRNDVPTIVEDIPALVCGSCMEQYYDDDVAEALRRLAEDGGRSDVADRSITVPVYSLKTRLIRRVLSDDVHVD
jgi:YgiT-type zinc finger domain-containing protein